MKYKSLLVFSMLLAVIAVSCSKENASDVKFTGIEVEVGDNGEASRLLILNEGAYPGASILDLLDFKNKIYSANVFAQANPGIAQGIGNTANDIVMAGGRVWALMNASNQVVVMDPKTLKVLKTLDVDSPRFMTADANYAYITSYGAAIYGSQQVINGWLYRINLNSYSTERVQVGPQPEGVVIHGGKIYVANSGGYYDKKSNLISVVDAQSFTAGNGIELPVANLKMLFESENALWVTTYDTYGPAPDYSFIEAAGLYKVNYDGSSFTTIEGISPTYAQKAGDTIYAFTYGTLNKVLSKTGVVEALTLAGTAIEYAYIGGMCVNPSNGDIIVSDAKYEGNSSVICVNSNLAKKWVLEAGVGAGHLLIY